MSIVVMVDSGASFSKTMLKKYGISLLPYNVIFKNGDCYKDVIDIKNQNDLIKIIDEHGDFPRIDQVGVDQIEAYFRKYIDRGDDILYISVSSGLSNAYNEVLQVANKFDSGIIEVIDSLNVGDGETLLAVCAKDYISKGYGIKQTAKYLNNIKHHIKSCYTIGNTTCLYRQCRCMQIQDNYMDFYHRIPIGEIDNGKIVLTFSARNHELAMQVLKNTIIDYTKDADINHIIVSYSGNKDDALIIKGFIHKHLKDFNIILLENSSVVFINTGINTLGISFLLNKK